MAELGTCERRLQKQTQSRAYCSRPASTEYNGWELCAYHCNHNPPLWDKERVKEFKQLAESISQYYNMLDLRSPEGRATLKEFNDRAQSAIRKSREARRIHQEDLHIPLGPIDGRRGWNDG